MSLHFLKNVGSLFFLSVFSLHIQAAEDNCMHIFTNMQHRFSVSDVSFTATVGDLRSIIPFSYRHDYANGHEYTVWRTLNGESEGYAVERRRPRRIVLTSKDIGAPLCPRAEDVHLPPLEIIGSARRGL